MKSTTKKFAKKIVAKKSPAKMKTSTLTRHTVVADTLSKGDTFFVTSKGVRPVTMTSRYGQYVNYAGEGVTGRIEKTSKVWLDDSNSSHSVKKDVWNTGTPGPVKGAGSVPHSGARKPHKKSATKKPTAKQTSAAAVPAVYATRWVTEMPSGRLSSFTTINDDKMREQVERRLNGSIDMKRGWKFKWAKRGANHTVTVVNSKGAVQHKQSVKPDTSRA